MNDIQNKNRQIKSKAGLRNSQKGSAVYGIEAFKVQVVRICVNCPTSAVYGSVFSRHCLVFLIVELQRLYYVFHPKVI